jgi:hypothetical protein
LFGPALLPLGLFGANNELLAAQGLCPFAGTQYYFSQPNTLTIGQRVSS